MKKWILSCSKKAISIDYEEIINSEEEPDFWTCYEIAEKHDCEWFSIYEMGEELHVQP